MIRPTETQIARLLALPIEWRRRLAEAAKDEPGWWVTPTPTRGPRLWFVTDPGCGDIQHRYTEQERAYAPCCALVWLRATGEKWTADSGRRIGYPLVRVGDDSWRPHIDAALLYMAVNPCPETTP
jgi:hypothetical protein